MKQLIEEYKKRRSEIEKRLKEFECVWQQSDERVFAELAFCLCTPQSSALRCWSAIETIFNNRVLFIGDPETIEGYLKGVRFHRNKAKYIVLARYFFTENGKLELKSKINGMDVFEKREFLVKNIKGIGYKEASHFLRNIGFGRDLAILDRHIMKNLKRFGVINGVPKALTKERYMDIENGMKKFSAKIGIPLDHVDLLLWSMETGSVFK